MASLEGGQPRPRPPPMASHTPPVGSFRSRHSIASIRSVATSAFSIDPTAVFPELAAFLMSHGHGFHGHSHGSRSRPQSAVSLGSPAVAAVADANALPDFAFLSYAALPRGPATLGVRDEASWSYSGPLLNLVGPHEDGRILPSSFYEFAENALTSKTPPCVARRSATPRYYSDSEDDEPPPAPAPAETPAAADVLAAALVPFLLFVNSFLAANDVHHYWITVRSTRPSHEFDMPRWHTDDFFWDTFRNLRRPTGPCKGECLHQEHDHIKRGAPRDLATDWKLCTTLLGPPTLFVPLPYQAAARSLQRKARAIARKAHACTSIRCVGCTTAAQAVREVLGRDLGWMGVVRHSRFLGREEHQAQDQEDDGELVPHTRRQGGVGQCSFFRIGEERGAVHSEPRITEDRIFVNIVPAREDELEKLMSRWGMSYPRDWWVATETVRRFPTSGATI